MDANKANILVVDDEMGPRESLKMILYPYYNVYTADRGAQAIEMLKKFPVDLVTLDLKMPGFSGIKVLEKVKQHDPDIGVRRRGCAGSTGRHAPRRTFAA